MTPPPSTTTEAVTALVERLDQIAQSDFRVSIPAHTIDTAEQAAAALAALAKERDAAEFLRQEEYAEHLLTFKRAEKAERDLAEARRMLERIAGMCGIPDPVEACRLICKDARDYLDRARSQSQPGPKEG